MCVRARGSTVRESGYDRIVYLRHELLEGRKREGERQGREGEREGYCYVCDEEYVRVCM